MDYARRQDAIAQELERRRLDAFLVTHLPNVRYLCGFTGSAGILAWAGERWRLFTDGRYTEQARAEVQEAQVVVGKAAPQVLAARWVAGSGARSCGVEAEYLTLAARASWRKLMPRPRLGETSGLVMRLRMVKEPGELRRLREAVRLGDRLFRTAAGAIRPGVRETEVAARLEYAARRAGADAMAFDTIVAGGARSALPHGRASSQTVPNTGFVIIDFGVILAGYCSDMSRTIYVGKPTAEARRVYRVVREAQQAAVAAVRAGVTAGEVDRAARGVLRRARLGKFFTHSTGHGVGLEIHEPPRLGSGQGEVLQPGMVVTIEPGVYLPGRGGVRIEDMVAVTETGCEVLTSTTKELIEL